MGIILTLIEFCVRVLAIFFLGKRSAENEVQKDLVDAPHTDGDFHNRMRDRIKRKT